MAAVTPVHQAYLCLVFRPTFILKVNLPQCPVLLCLSVCSLTELLLNLKKLRSPAPLTRRPVGTWALNLGWCKADFSLSAFKSQRTAEQTHSVSVASTRTYSIQQWCWMVAGCMSLVIKYTASTHLQNKWIYQPHLEVDVYIFSLQQMMRKTFIFITISS